jgi:hypothetical protein
MNLKRRHQIMMQSASSNHDAKRQSLEETGSPHSESDDKARLFPRIMLRADPHSLISPGLMKDGVTEQQSVIEGLQQLLVQAGKRQQASHQNQTLNLHWNMVCAHLEQAHEFLMLPGMLVAQLDISLNGISSASGSVAVVNGQQLAGVPPQQLMRHAVPGAILGLGSVTAQPIFNAHLHSQESLSASTNPGKTTVFTMESDSSSGQSSVLRTNGAPQASRVCFFSATEALQSSTEVQHMYW